MPFDIGTLGMTAATDAIGTGMGLLLEGHNDRRQLNQAQKLQDLQIKGQKELTDYNMSKQLDMWKNTSYPAQVEQMNKAGINPALLYGIGGGGGQTTGNTTSSVSGQDAPKGGGEILAEQQYGMQLALLNAQKENIQADTRLKEVNATKAEGAETTKIQNETELIKQNVKTQKAQEALINAETALKQLDIDFNKYTLTEREDIIHQTLTKLNQDIDIGDTQLFVSAATQNQVVDMIKQKAATAVAETELLRAMKDEKLSNIQVNDEKIKTMAQEISASQTEIIQKWTSLSQDQQNIDIQKAWQKFQTDPTWKEFGLQTFRAIIGEAGNVAGQYATGKAISGGGKRTQIGFKY